MARYEFESFVFGSTSRRDPEDLANVFLKKARHGGVARIGEEVYNVRSVTSGMYSGAKLSLSNPHTKSRLQIAADDGVLMSDGEIVSGDVTILTSCPECFSQEIAVIDKNCIKCSNCSSEL